MQENLNLVEGNNIELIRVGNDVSVNNTYQYDDSGIEAEIQAVADSLVNYSLVTETGNKVTIDLNNTNYKMTVKLYDKNNNLINTSNEVDLPIEQLVKSITYDSETKEIVFTLQDGTQTRVPLSDLIDGLATESEVNDLKNKVEAYKTVFNALPHIEDEDTEMTLDDTANSVMEIKLKGNTSQDTTTGKNKLNIPNSTYTDRGITNTTTNGIWVSTGTASANGSVSIGTLDEEYTIQDGDYLYLFNNSIPNGTAQIFAEDSSNGQIFAKTINATNFKVDLSSYAGQKIKNVKLYVVSGTIMNMTSKLMIANSSSETEWEEYSGGYASPSPNWEQPIEVVKGNNNIKIGNKNLFDGMFKSGTLDTGVNYTNIALSRTSPYKDLTSKYYTFGGYFKAGTYTFIVNKSNFYISLNRAAIAGTSAVGSSQHIRNSYTWEQSVDGYTYFSIERDAGETDYTDINFSGDDFQLMVNEGDTALSFEPYKVKNYSIDLGTLELCKIGDYKDYFTKNTGKNIYELPESETKTGITFVNNGNGTFNISGTATATTSFSKILNRSLPNGVYTLWKNTNETNLKVYIQDYQDNTWQSNMITMEASNQTTKQINPIGNKTILLMQIPSGTTINLQNVQLQLENNSSKTEFEPYGTGKWCKYNAIGKVVLSGSWNWNVSNSGTDNYIYYAYPSPSLYVKVATNGICNRYPYHSIGNDTYQGIYWASSFFRVRYGVEQPTADYKTWLNNNNVIFYYVYATPYLSLVENATLCKQLDEFENVMSYQDQTHITQENADKPFIISASALKDLTNLESGE